VSNLALNLDLAPTLVDFAGAPALRGTQGRSLKPLVQGHQPRWRESFIYEYNYEEQFPYTPNVRALRTDRWKFIRYPHGDGSADRFTAELYDLANDPDELRNLIQDPAAAPVRRRLEKDLTRISRESGPDRMPVYGGIVNVLPKY
jgi:N-acetylglucosamine-6-sulfatase